MTDNVTIEELVCGWMNAPSLPLEVHRGMESILGGEKTAEVFTRTVSHPLDLRLSVGIDASSLAGEKFVKAVASEFSYLRYPGDDTSALTNVTRVLISENTLGIALRHFFGVVFSARKIFMPFLALVIYTSGIREARTILLPLFAATIRSNQYNIDLPKLICKLRPGLRFSNFTEEEKLEVIVKALLERDIVVKKEVDTSHGVEHEQRYTIRVLQRGEEVSCETGKFLEDYRATITEQAKIFLEKECGGGGPENASRLLSAPNMKMWMHELHALLRMQASYKEKMGKSFIEDVRKCEGWIPLSEVLRLLSQRCESTLTMTPSEDELLELLEKHDHFCRFEVGTCDVPGGRFDGQRCARSLYGHEISTNLSVYTFKSFVREQDPSQCPQYSWILIGKPTIKKLHKEPLKLYSNILFVQSFAQESIDEFYRYRSETPNALQFDEKLSCVKSLYFLQFCLRAAVRDPKMRVLRMPKRGSSQVSWMVFSDRHEDCEVNGEKQTQIPRYYFTGKLLTLNNPGAIDREEHKEAGESVEATRLSRLDYLKDIEVRGFEPGEEQRIFLDDRTHTDGDGEKDFPGDEKVVDSDGERRAFVVSCDEFRFEAASVASALDTLPAQKKVLALIDNPDLCFTRVSFPRSDPKGLPIPNRSKDITKFKQWVRQRGLMYRVCTTRMDKGNDNKNNNDDEDDDDDDDDDDDGGSFQETYEITKRGVWDMQFIRHIADDLGLGGIPDHRLLRRALTRECEDASECKLESYEILEFTGDAVMDFIVAFDHFVLGRTCSETVITLVCRNAVLAQLIPSKLSERLDKCYSNINSKVKADMMESIVGATYRSGMGLDEVRALLRRFFERIPSAIKECVNDEEKVNELRNAEGACPYLQSDADVLTSRFQYHCVALIDKEAALAHVLPPVRLFDCNGNSHSASTPFDRIQDKQYATHFTTGKGYSYRHVDSIDFPRMFNRILQSFDAGSITFVNENLTNSIHMTIDFDGADIREDGVLHLVWKWFEEQFASKSSMLLLDCSGMSVVSKKLKQSCHIHFPQAACTLDSMQKLTDKLRQFLVDSLARQSFIGTVVGYEKLQEGGVTSAFIGFVVFCTKYLQDQWQSLQKGEEVDVSRCFGRFAPLKERAESVGKSPSELLESLNELRLKPRELAKWFGIPERQIFGGNVVNDDTRFVVVQVHWASSTQQNLLKTLVLVDSSLVKVITVENAMTTVPQVTRLIEEKEKEVTLKEFIEKGITPLRQSNNLCGGFWEKVIDSGLVESKKLRMYLNDKFDMKYGQEYRPLFLDTIYQPDGEIQTLRPDKVKKPKSGNQVENDSTYPVEIAHASVLRLTSLRSPDYRDVDGCLRSPWAEGCNTDAAFGDFDAISPTRDILPTFDMLKQKPDVASDNWTTWVSAVCVLEANTVVSRDSKESDVKVAALQPAYWTYRKGAAVLWIAGETAMRVENSVGLFDALSGRNGMAALARLVVPGISTEGHEFAAEWITAYSERVFPLFFDLRKKRVGPAPTDGFQTNAQRTQEKQAETARALPLGIASGGMPPLSKKDVRLIEWSKTDDPDAMCTLVLAALRGICEAPLLVTSNVKTFASLSGCFPNVVSPSCFSRHSVKHFQVFFQKSSPHFQNIFVIGDDSEPYEVPGLATAIWSSLCDTGTLYATNPCVKNCLMGFRCGV